jgi:hypothetical protein
VDGTGSGSCPITNFGVIRLEISSSANVMLVT